LRCAPYRIWFYINPLIKEDAFLHEGVLLRSRVTSSQYAKIWANIKRCLKTCKESVLTKAPDRIEVPAAWYGEALAQTPDVWTCRLSDAQISELVGAAKAFIDSGDALSEITREAFSLPRLGPSLQRLAYELKSGLGFALLTGFPSEEHSRELNATVFCGLAPTWATHGRKTRPVTSSAMSRIWAQTHRTLMPRSTRLQPGRLFTRTVRMWLDCSVCAKPKRVAKACWCRRLPSITR